MIEIGLLVGAVGGAVLVMGGVSPARRSAAIAVAGALIALGFVLALIAVHFGVSPFQTVPKH